MARRTSTTKKLQETSPGDKFWAEDARYAPQDPT